MSQGKMITRGQKTVAPDDRVFITDELVRRRPGKPNYLQEKLALQDLAAKMADQPETILPRFVDLAMELAGGVSAGISLYEENPAPGVFRWHYLRGILAPFDGATTPRHFSPCGITLDQNAPVLCRHPERVYDWIAAANIVVPEVLLVPLHVGSKEPLGTLWIVSKEVGHFDSGHARVMTELASFVGIAVRMLKTEGQLHRALEEQETLTREMGHRVKNLFAIAGGLIRVSAKAASTPAQMAEILSGRMEALASANALVRRSFDDKAPAEAQLGELVRKILLPHERHTGTAFAVVNGPQVRLGDRATNGIALVLHEMATNAAKYGALKLDTGSVSVTWNVVDDTLLLDWTERGGPPIEAPPDKTGFGTKLSHTTVVGQFSGTISYDWHASGLTVRMALPTAKLLQ